jgi:hypothetical protein
MTNEPLFEATVLPGRALSWSGRLYLENEIVLLPLDEANALEGAGFVEVASQSVKTSKTRSRTAA